MVELRHLKDELNFLSHKGIAHCLDYEPVHEEANKILGNLWFDDITMR